MGLGSALDLHACVAPSSEASIYLDGGFGYELEGSLTPAGLLSPAARAVCHTFSSLLWASVRLLAFAVHSKQKDHRLEDGHPLFVDDVSHYTALIAQACPRPYLLAT